MVSTFYTKITRSSNQPCTARIPIITSEVNWDAQPAKEGRERPWIQGVRRQSELPDYGQPGLLQSQTVITTPSTNITCQTVNHWDHSNLFNSLLRSTEEATEAQKVTSPDVESAANSWQDWESSLGVFQLRRKGPWVLATQRSHERERLAWKLGSFTIKIRTLSKNLHFAHGSYCSKTTQDSISRQASPDTGL